VRGTRKSEIHTARKSILGLQVLLAFVDIIVPCGTDLSSISMSIFGLVLKPLAYLGVPVFILHRLSQSSPTVRYYYRLSLYVSTLSICSAWGVVVSIALSVVGQRFNVNWVIARSFYALAGRVLSIRFVVQGEEHLDTRPAVLVGNHQSMLDILYLGRCVCLAKSQFTYL
jgi:hypothetical protein